MNAVFIPHNFFRLAFLIQKKECYQDVTLLDLLNEHFVFGLGYATFVNHGTYRKFFSRNMCKLLGG